MLLVVYSSACAIFITILSLVAELFPLELVILLNHCNPEHYFNIFSSTALKFTYNVCVYMKLCICNFHVRLSVRLWTQFCLELFSYSFPHTALKFIHNVCVYMKLCICNFHVRLSVDTSLSGATLTKPFSIL